MNEHFTAAMSGGQHNEQDLKAVVDRHFDHSIAVAEHFFSAHDEQIAQACWAMARRFHAGGRLLAFGNGGAATDAQHVAVEFVHPVIVGKRALPALALTNDSAVLTGLAAGGPAAFARQVAILGRSEDIALGFCPGGVDDNVRDALATAGRGGMLTIALTGGDSGSLSDANLDYCFVVPDDDQFIVQETHETLYHVLWELVHIFFEHEGLLT
ncbi:MAG: SIS domain-containing protein [Herpetosiphon sp.]